MFDSACGVVHTAVACEPSIGTRQRSPFFETSSARPSLLQLAPANDEPAAPSSRGADAPSAAATYTFDMPARSQTNTTDRPSGLHIAFDGCLMSISCAIVR